MRFCRYFYWVIAIGSFPAYLFGQQTPMFTVGSNVSDFIIPASINSTFFVEDVNWRIGATYRGQAFGRGNAQTPQTYALGIEHYRKLEFKKSNSDISEMVRLLIGFNVLKDEFGPTNATTIVGKIGILLGRPESDQKLGELGGGLGFQVGYNQFNVKVSEIDFIDPADIGPNILSKTLALTASGYIYGRIDDDFEKNIIYAGLAMHRVSDYHQDFAGENSFYNLTYVPHYNFMTGWLFAVSDEYLVHDISVWFRYVPKAPLSSTIDYRFPIWGVSSDETPLAFWGGIGGSTSSNIFESEVADIVPYSWHVRTEIDFYPSRESNYTNQIRQKYRLSLTYEQPLRELQFLGPNFELTLSCFFKPYKSFNFLRSKS